jgi:hypothetical protein
MTNLDPLILDFLEWVAKEPRPYADVMDAWRTSCPRLTVWEDAMDRAFVARVASGAGPIVTVTQDGLTFLAANRPVASVEASGIGASGSAAGLH